jgi:hypothetical protein
LEVEVTTTCPPQLEIGELSAFGDNEGVIGVGREISPWQHIDFQVFKRGHTDLIPREAGGSDTQQLQ